MLLAVKTKDNDVSKSVGSSTCDEPSLKVILTPGLGTVCSGSGQSVLNIINLKFNSRAVC